MSVSWVGHSAPRLYACGTQVWHARTMDRGGHKGRAEARFARIRVERRGCVMAKAVARRVGRERRGLEVQDEDKEIALPRAHATTHVFSEKSGRSAASATWRRWSMVGWPG
jgi:hypothetical protein